MYHIWAVCVKITLHTSLGTGYDQTAATSWMATKFAHRQSVRLLSLQQRWKLTISCSQSQKHFSSPRTHWGRSGLPCRRNPIA